jgi:hypothetical protein
MFSLSLHTLSALDKFCASFSTKVANFLFLAPFSPLRQRFSRNTCTGNVSSLPHEISPHSILAANIGYWAILGQTFHTRLVIPLFCSYHTL